MAEPIAPSREPRDAGDVAELATAAPRIDLVAAALAAAQAEFPAIPKTRTAQVRTRDGGSYSYHFADLSDVNRAVVPILAKHGLAVVQTFETRE